MSDLKKIENNIRKALKQQGTYSKDMDTAIYLAAVNIMALNIAVKDIQDLETTVIEEKSRENNIKLVAHPAFKVLDTTSEAVRKCLRELRLTLATVEAVDDDSEDGINGLIDAVDSVK